MQSKFTLFDATGVEYYSDKAVIENTRTYPNGKNRTLTMEGVKYKKLLKMVMPLAKKKGDKSIYKEVTYVKKDGLIIVKAKRWSVLKKYETPYEAHFRVIDGSATIIKEISQSKP